MKKFKTIIPFFFFIASHLFAFGQDGKNSAYSPPSGRLSGFVYDKQTGLPIPDANIIISGTSLGTASQDGGYYFIEKIPVGVYEIVVRVMGYKTETKKEIRISNATILDFQLNSQAIQVDPILVTATRSDHLQSKITVSAEVLTPARIKEQTGNTVGEVTEAIGGLYTRSYDGFAGPQTPSIRGSNPSQVLVLLDGQRLNGAQGGGVDLNAFPIESIERIEIIRGGHSALVGTDAIGGVIHLISNESIPPRGFSYGIQSTIGSFGTQTLNATGSHKIGPLTSFISYNQTKSKGNFTYQVSDTDQRNTRENNDYEGNNILFKSNLTLGKHHLFRFLFQSFLNKRGVIGSIEWPSTQARREEDRKLFSLQFENQLAHSFRLKGQVFYNSYDNHYTNPGGWIPEDDLHKSKALGSEVQFQWKINPHFIIYNGGEIRSEELVSTKFPDVTRLTLNAFAQGEISYSMSVFDIDTRWKLIPAIRWSKYEDSGERSNQEVRKTWGTDSRISPKIGILISHGNETNISIKGNIGRAYRVPSLFDLYWPEDYYTKGNPTLLPEISWNYDVGLSYSRSRSSYFQFDITYFKNDFEDLILWDASPEDRKWMPRNIGRALVKGIENMVTFRLPGDNAYVKLAHTWMNATDETPDSATKGNKLIYRPENKIDIITGLNFKYFRINFNYRIVSERHTQPDNKQSLPEYHLLNGNISGSFSLGALNMEAKLQTLNLLNKSIYLLDGYPLPGREYRLTVGFQY